ncbi:BppU family phage baseplate upper protein [Clostridium formicaceticum]|uniref:BppU N-terminal domain-containing protein n=1 Tax=Clostridium formicaceticum TaxID=1497 RepID=A0AAC9WFX9_9CLOT|nr:BppU family phage baseplate upper protein [Clostridium formicaceticum]AOY76923.1 hypothetical protein BJL90_14295 [Clostridium formicaceticum]ARE87402.1 hypothetical protein CLFO_18020 [Clostridium formicaceticum]
MITKDFNINVDFERATFVNRITFVRGDTKANKIKFKLTKNNLPIDLNQVTVGITFLRSDNVKIIAEAEKIGNNEAEYLIASNILDVPGQVLVSVALFGGDGERLTVPVQFPFTVVADLGFDADEIAEDDRYPILTQLINDVQGFINDVNTTMDNYQQSINNDVDQFKGEIEGFKNNIQQSENTRVVNENNRVTAEYTRVNNEDTRQQQETSRQAKILDIENRWDTLQTSQQQDAEIINARTSTVKSKTFPALTNRIEEIEQDIVKPIYSTPVMTYDTAIYLGMEVSNTNAQISVQIFGRSLRQELNYNRSTWVEWTLEDSSIVENGRLKLIRTTLGRQAFLNTNVKSSTKYGILLYVYENTGNLTTQGNNTPFGDSSVLISGVGNKKAILTTQSSFTVNSLALKMSGNSTSVTIQDIRLFELPSGSEIESDFTNLTADQLAVKYPYIKGDGTKSTLCGGQRMRSIGLNHFNPNKANITVGKYLESTGGEIGNPSTSYTKGVFKVKPSTPYVRSISNRWYFFDRNKNFISRSDNVTAIITPDNCHYVGLQGLDTTNWNIEYIYEGTTSGEYKPYIESTRYYPITDAQGNIIYLRSLPNGTKDEISDDGKLTKRVSDDFKLQSGHITSVNTTPANVDIVQLENFYNNILPNAVQQTNAINSTTSITGWTERAPATNADEYTIADVGKFYTLSNQGLRLIVAKNTYTNIEAARNALTGMTVNYQLMQSSVTQLPPQEKLIAYPGGHLFIEPFTKLTKPYGEGITLPIAVKGGIKDNIESIIRLDGTTRTNIDKANVTLTGNVVTISGATANQIYEVVWEYPSELSATPQISWSVPINIAASIESANKTAVETNKELNNYRAFNNAMLFNHEIRLVMLESK